MSNKQLSLFPMRDTIDKVLTAYDRQFLALSDADYEKRCKKLVRDWQGAKRSMISYSPVEIEILKEHCVGERCYTRAYDKCI